MPFQQGEYCVKKNKKVMKNVNFKIFKRAILGFVLLILLANNVFAQVSPPESVEVFKIIVDGQLTEEQQDSIVINDDYEKTLNLMYELQSILVFNEDYPMQDIKEIHLKVNGETGPLVNKLFKIDGSNLDPSEAIHVEGKSIRIELGSFFGVKTIEAESKIVSRNKQLSASIFYTEQ